MAKRRPDIKRTAKKAPNKNAFRRKTVIKKVLRKKIPPKAAKPAKVVVKANWKLSFLDGLSQCGNVSEACRAAKVARAWVYEQYDADPAFKKAWKAAAVCGNHAIEDEMRRRAMKGWLEPVHYKGEVVGHVRKFSDGLLTVLAKANMPEKYRERLDVKGSMKLDLSDMSDAEFEQLKKAMERAGISDA